MNKGREAVTEKGGPVLFSRKDLFLARNRILGRKMTPWGSKVNKVKNKSWSNMYVPIAGKLRAPEFHFKGKYVYLLNPISLRVDVLPSSKNFRA